jgi:nicotinamide-nucleotide amidase
MQPQGQVQVLCNLIDHGMNVQEAGESARCAHYGSSTPTGEQMTNGGEVVVESGISDEVIAALKAKGHKVTRGRGGFGGYQGIWWDWKSDVFRGGVVAYSNDVKAAELGVPRGVLEEHGAVSAETAKAMAEGARERLGADLAVAVTGVAGPGGGTEEKPVGLVYLHAAGPFGEAARKTDLPGDREMVRGRATAAALHLLRAVLTQTRDEGV